MIDRFCMTLDVLDKHPDNLAYVDKLLRDRLPYFASPAPGIYIIASTYPWRGGTFYNKLGETCSQIDIKWHAEGVTLRQLLKKWRDLYPDQQVFYHDWVYSAPQYSGDYEPHYTDQYHTENSDEYHC